MVRAVYVARRLKLLNAVTGTGAVKVHVATRRCERVSEQSDLHVGPLRGARKVDSCARTLVSAMDVAEQVDEGAVEFTTDAADVSSTNGGVTRTTKT